MNNKKMIDVAVLMLYIGIIYSTLSVMPVVFSFFSKLVGPKGGLVIDIAAFVMIVTVCLLFGSRLGRNGVMPYIWLMVILSVYVYVLMECTPIIAEKVHLLEYGFLAYLVWRVFRDVRQEWIRYLLITALVVAVGWCDELIQGTLPNRVYDVRDIYLNILSGLLGLALVMLLAPGRDRR
ncbi:MAG: VanZ family protein [Candidatus Omnitrophota bacterium]